MRNNYIQTGTRGIHNRTYIEGDWYDKGIPANVATAENVYIDTSYGFTAFNSMHPIGMRIDEATGCYDRSSFIVSATGKVEVGKFTILNGTSIVCNEHITIGDHCMLAWGSVITDTWVTPSTNRLEKAGALEKSYSKKHRPFPFTSNSIPVVIEDNCWVGFGSVIMPGVRLGHGCIVGCKTIVYHDVPPYAIVAGSDAKIIRYLNEDDDKETREAILRNTIVHSNGSHDE